MPLIWNRPRAPQVMLFIGAGKRWVPCHLHRQAHAFSIWGLERWKIIQIGFIFFNQMFTSCSKAQGTAKAWP